MSVLLLLICLLPGCLAGCEPGLVAVYNVSLVTHWDPASYPKQFPTWRPPAQWSQVTKTECIEFRHFKIKEMYQTFGISHSGAARLFQLGEVASDGAAKFVETGETEGLVGAL